MKDELSLQNARPERFSEERALALREFLSALTASLDGASSSQTTSIARTAIRVSRLLLDVLERNDRFVEAYFRDKRLIKNLEKGAELSKALQETQGKLAAVALDALIKAPDRFLRRRNRVAAQAPRADSLSRTLAEILGKNPDATEADVFLELRAMADAAGGVIESVTDDTIEWTNTLGNVETTTVKALKHRISRARKRTKSR